MTRGWGMPGPGPSRIRVEGFDSGIFGAIMRFTCLFPKCTILSGERANSVHATHLTLICAVLSAILNETLHRSITYMSKKSILYILIPLLTVLLAACAPSGPSTSIKVAMTDFAFSPNKFTVPAGQQIA